MSQDTVKIVRSMARQLELTFVREDGTNEDFTPFGSSARIDFSVAASAGAAPVIFKQVQAAGPGSPVLNPTTFQLSDEDTDITYGTYIADAVLWISGAPYSTKSFFVEIVRGVTQL